MFASVRFRLKTRHLITLLLLSTVLLIQSAQSVPLSSQSLMKAPKSMNPSDSNSSTSTSTSTSNESISANWPAWRAQIVNVRATQAGCFAVTYPSTVWQPRKCVTARVPALRPSSSANTGDGNDEVAQAPSGTFIIPITGVC